MKNEDFDFIKNKFDEENICAPNNISENNILNKLEGLDSKQKPKLYQRSSFKAVMSAVACLILVVGVVAYALPKQLNEPQLESSEQAVMSFNSYADIMKKVNKITDGLTYKGSDLATNESAEETSNAVNLYSETYVQVDGVDEGDIIKNDGKYIYYVNEEQEIMIYEGETLVTTINDFYISDTYSDYYSDDSKYIDDIYVKDNRLIVNVDTDIWNNEKYEFYQSVYIYDLSSITQPKLINEFQQTGSYLTSRLIDNVLYVVSNKYLEQCKDEAECYITTSVGQEETTLPASSIMYGDNIDSADYLVISAIDVDNAERTAEPKAFFGSGSDIYCNQNNMYIVVYGNEKTEIVKTELTSSAINFVAKATVSGYVDSQYSMNEKDGYFRVATSDDNGNNLFVFDSELNEVGKVTGFAKGESIRAVNYLGDMAYVITYEQTDPLFVIDLSNPSAPEIKGSVEITGFSSNLVFVDENTILGVGYDDTWGIKLALFDVSNPTSPKVLDSYVMENAYSNAQSNYKAIVVNRDKGYFAIDYNKTSTDDYSTVTGGLIINVENGKINITNNYKLNTGDNCSYAQRLTYINDTIYILDDYGNIYSFNN